MATPPKALTRPATSVLLMLAFAAEQGVAEVLVLGNTGYSRARLSEAGASVPAAVELEITCNFLAALKHVPGLGVKMGQRYSLASYGIWGFALMSCGTLGEACEMGLRYLDLTYSDLNISLQTQGDKAAIVFQAQSLPTTLQRFLVERDSSACINILCELTVGLLQFTEIEFSFPAPLDHQEITIARSVYGHTPQYGAVESRLWFNAQHLALPLPHANASMASVAEAQCRVVVGERRIRTGMVAQVRDTLLRTFALGRSPPSQESISGLLACTPRTLHRRLKSEGSSYRQLLEEIRQTLANELTLQQGLKLEEIAQQLGYADASAFLHARRRWRTRRAA